MKFCKLLTLSLGIIGLSALGGDLRPIHVGYDRSSTGGSYTNWHQDINRLIDSGFPLKKVPSSKKTFSGAISEYNLGKADCAMIIGGGTSTTTPIIRRFVKSGGGLVVYGNASKELEEILPVTINSPRRLSVMNRKDNGFSLKLTTKQSPLTEIWRNNKGLPIPNRGSIMNVTAKPDSEVLAYFVDTKGNKFPALVTSSFGKGKIVYFAGSLDRISTPLHDLYDLQWNYSLNALWTYHPTWDAAQLSWLAYSSNRTTFAEKVIASQEYLYARKKFFSHATNLLQMNSIVQVENQDLANQELTRVKSALWDSVQADKLADSYDFKAAQVQLENLTNKLPKTREYVEGPASEYPGDGYFWSAGSMMDAVHMTGAYNDKFLNAFYKDYKDELHFDGDAFFASYPLSYLNKNLSGIPQPSDYKFDDGLNLEGMEKNNLKGAFTVMQRLGRHPRLNANAIYQKKNKNEKSDACPLIEEAYSQGASFFSPSLTPWMKPFYQELGRYCNKKDIISVVEYCNEPTLRSYEKRKNYGGRLNTDFRNWLKNKYQNIEVFNTTFGLTLKQWEDIPDWRSVMKKLKRQKTLSKGIGLNSEDGISWQICPTEGIINIGELQGKKWLDITVPNYFEKVLGSVNGTYWYRTKVKLTAGDKLYFAGVDDDASVYVNGRRIKVNRGYNRPFHANIPEDLTIDQEAELLVKVEDTRGKGGIYGDVLLQPKSLSNVLSELKKPETTDINRIYWGLWSEFCAYYPYEGCKRFASWVREGTNKTLVDRSRGATFDTSVPYQLQSKIPNVFGPHATSNLSYDYAEGLNYAPEKIVSEYYFIGYGERDPETGKTPLKGQLGGSFYRKHPRAEYLASNKARIKFWEMAARGFDGLECFVPTTFRWNTHALGTRNYWIGLYWSFYSVRFEPRIPVQVLAANISQYKNMYKHVKKSKADHKMHILVSQAGIGQSQLGVVNTMHPIKSNARALYQMLSEDMKTQVGFIDTEKFVTQWCDGDQTGKLLFVVLGQFIEPKTVEALTSFMNNGGTVAAFGPTGLYDEYGRWIYKNNGKAFQPANIYTTQKNKLFYNDISADIDFTNYNFTMPEGAEAIISATKNDKDYASCYRQKVGKGNYWQLGIMPDNFKSIKGYDNVDEAMLYDGNETLAAGVKINLLMRGILNRIITSTGSESRFKISEDGKFFIRKKNGEKLVFVFNTDLMEAKNIKIDFDNDYDISIIYGKGLKKYGQSRSWNGSIAPGGGRLLKLSRKRPGFFESLKLW